MIRRLTALMFTFISPFLPHSTRFPGTSPSFLVLLLSSPMVDPVPFSVSGAQQREVVAGNQGLAPRACDGPARERAMLHAPG